MSPSQNESTLRMQETLDDDNRTEMTDNFKDLDIIS